MTDISPAGLKRPDDASIVATTPATLRQHANSIQTGEVAVSAVSLASGGGVSVAITFPTPFATPPKVVASGAGYASGGAFLSVRGCVSITETGFSLHVQNNGASAATFTDYRFQWIAVGEGTEVGG